MTSRNPQKDLSLSVRLRNVLYFMEIDSEEKLDEALGSGLLRTKRNIGPKSIAEAAAWLRAQSFAGMEDGAVLRLDVDERGWKIWRGISAVEDKELAPMMPGQALVFITDAWPVGTVIEVSVPRKAT